MKYNVLKVDKVDKMYTILLVEDDKGLRIGLSYDLEAEMYEVIAVDNGRDALEVAMKSNIHLVLLDVNLPDINGFLLAKELKKIKDLPMIFLTACDLIQDQVKGFEVGADDYITKPFSNVLLRKRIQAVLKRYTSKAEDIYSDGFLTIHFNQLTIQKDSQNITLTPTEFKLLKVLIANAGNIVTRQLILDKLWDNEGNFVDEHALTVNINRLRNKLETDTHKYIKTVYGLGYLWVGEKLD